jgi:hypothetical protein
LRVKAERGRAVNEPIAKRKAPDLFVAALIRLIAEIKQTSPGKGNAVRRDGSRFNKAQSTFDDYLAGLLRFKQGVRETTFYQKLFPELFQSPRSAP